MGWWIALAVLLLLALLPVGVCAGYGEQGGWVRLVLGPVRIRLYPRRKKPEDKQAPDDAGSARPAAGKTEKTPAHKKQKPKADAKKDAEKDTKKDAEESPSGGSVENLKVLLPAALELLSGLRRRLRVRRLELYVCLAGEDPCDVALNYGRAWAAVGNFMPWLERFFRIGRRDIQIDCDFAAEQTTVRGRVDAVLGLGQLTVLLIRALVRAAKGYLAKNNKKKAVQQYE